jgi:hypothetical protein
MIVRHEVRDEKRPGEMGDLAVAADYDQRQTRRAARGATDAWNQRR